MTREVILGIDFGSSSTIAGVLVGDRIELVPDGGDCVIPSVVYYPDKGQPEIGRRAASRQFTEPSRVIRSVKRVLGLPSSAPLVRRYAAASPFKIECSGERPVFRMWSGDVAPEQVAAAILARVRDLAEARFGGVVRRVVMAMSAAAPPGYRDAVIRAARIARLEVMDLIAEPIAGALALDLHRECVNRRIIVCDFGGGTFDVSAVVQNDSRFTPVAIAGDSLLGGDDLDDALAEEIAGKVFRRSRYDMHKDAVRWSELVFRCESAKRQLSSAREAPLAMRGAYIEAGQPQDLRLTLEVPWVDAVWRELMQRVQGVVREALQRAGWIPTSVDVVGLIGGSSLVPAFRRALGELFPPARFVIAHDAEYAVAQGATILTARYGATTTGSIPVLVA